MHAWLKRAVAGLLSAVTLLGGGLLTAGTANADEIRMPDIGKTITSLTTSAATTYPRELVNGDFEYPSMKSLQHYFTGIDRNRSQWISNGQGGDLAKWSDIPGGLDTTRFGWSSTQTQGAMSEQRANAVELQKATGETTQMGELCASQKGTAIYQDIATTPGTLYRIELDHASRYRIHLDQMQVMVGAPGHEQPVEMTRTSSNKYGDKIGEKSTTIATHSTNPFGNQSSKDDFSHYVGYYTIPAGQSVTRFTFRQVSGVNTTSGNLLDNIVFTQAYKLSYDKNSDEATGQTPNGTATVKPAKTSATGGVKNIADTNASLPDHLVNGDFEYLPDGGWKTVDAPSYMTNAYTSVDPNNGQYMRNAKHSDADLASWVDWPGFDQSKFAWKSDQKGGHDQGGLKDRAEAVELQQDSMDGNTYAEMVASEPGRTIYQNLATIPGTLYKIRLKHASLCKDNVDRMQVVINGTPIEMTRVAANGKAGDKVGEKSKTIGTRVTNENRWHHSDQWETYEGYYVIPDGQTTTRFGFKAVNYLDPTKGNLLDDVTFARAYKLSYDKNASDATGKVPSDETADTVRQTKARTTGTVKTVADENVRYGSLANGDFSYPSFSDIQENEQETVADLRTFLKSDDGTLWYNMSTTDLSKYGKIGQIPGFDSSRFAWSSTENGSRVELQQDRNTKNTYAEIVAQQDNTSIYQNVSTGNGGVLYKIRLKHASRQSSHADKMQVLVGSDTDHATPLEMTRVTSNGHGDKVGGKSTIITTKVSNTDPRDHGAQWETYEGYYQVPEGQKNTVFMFKSLEGFKEFETLPGNNIGNLVDDIEFSRSYKLTYDKNASDATGKVPSNQRGKENTVQPAKSKTTGSVGLAADKTVSGLTVHDLKKNDKGKVPSSSKADSTQPAAFKAPDAKVETIASRAAGDELAVNGGFDTPKWTIAKEGQGLPWVYVKPNVGTIRSYAQAMAGQPGVKAGGLTAATFAWQDLDAIGSNQNFELHREKDGNTAADVHAGRTVAQTVNTTPGASYTFSIRHSGRSKGNAGGVTLLTGPDKDHLTPVKLTRTTVSKTGQKYGDKTGDVGTVAYTHSDSMDATEGSHEPWDHSDDWESYEGTVIIPAGQSRTMIAYRGVAKDGTLTASANDSIIDDLSFRLAYKLSYDANGGAKTSTSQIKASTDGKVKTIAGKTDSLPTELVNGSFDYPAGLIAGVSTKYPWDDWTVVDPINGRYARHIGIDKDPWAPIPGWDASKFAWKSTQTKGTDWQQIAQGVELQKDSKTGNQYAELVAGQAGTAIYQDIATIPGVSYRWTLKHASLDRNHLDGMSVMIGEPGKESAQDARRTTVNGNGDQPGDVGKVISTKVSNDAELGHESNHSSRNHDGQWETYTGTYIATGTVTRFTFKSVSSSNNVNGNILDDLSFTKAYRLGYDSNGGAKTGASKISANADGKVRLAAAKASVPSHDLETTDVPGQYRDFILDTTKVKFSDVKFENGAWLNAPMPDSGDGATAMFPLKIGASATLPNVGEWTDGSGHTHSINAIISLHSWNGGSISRLWTPLDGQPSTSRDLFWINTVGRNSDLPAQVIKALGGIDTSKRVGCQWTVNFTYEDGTPVPDTFRGVTGFNDLDGWDVQPDLKFEGVQLVSGFDGAYKTRDAELATYGINGFAGAKHDSGPESNLDGKQQVKHRLAATWTGSSFTFGYDLQNPEGRDRGSRMTFGVPVTRTKVLTYDANGGKGSVPSHTEAGKVEAASAKTAGSVHAISDATDTTGSAEGKAVSGVLTDTLLDAGDGTKQRTITRSDGSVRVETIATTGAVSGCQVYYPAGTRITLATAKADSDCWDSSQIGKTNRTFYGWSANTDANDRDVPVADTMDRNTLNANARTEIVMPARAKTVYALWAINPTLSYSVNAPAGSNAPGTPASQTVPYNPAAADKSGWAAGDTGKIPGYRFDGWYTAPNGGNKYDFNTPLTNNVTVYAHWIGNGYTVRFTGNGATGGNTPDQAFQYNIGQNLHRNGFTRDGYTFTGWKRADNQQAYGDGQWVTNLTTQPDGIVTMVAQWSANEAHIRYNPNPPAGKTAGGNGTPNWDGHTGDTPAIGGNGWTIDGYTFAGWTTSPDGSGTKYAPGASWTANGTLTLYAQWTPGEAGLTYDGNGATGGKTDPQNGVTDQKVNVRQNGFTRDGYTFVTWNTQADCKGNAVKPNSEWTLRGSSTLYACWAGVAQTLTYHGNGATGGNTAAQSGHTGDELTTNANGFTRDGYTFVRWDTAKDGSGTAYGEGKNGVGRYTMKPAGNDLYAIWQANPASIRYRDDWGATGSTPDTTGVTGQNVTIAQNGFTRPGYTFTGWARDRRTDPSLQPGGRYTLTPGTTTLWAQWKADPAHLIYNSNSGSTSQTRRTDGVVDQTLTVIANPFTRTGYTFTGWNTQADGRGRAYTAGNGFRLVADPKSNPVNTSVLYAQWRINRVTLKFNPNGGTGGYPDITVDAFTTVTIPADAKEPKVQRPGFRFTGWAMKPTPGAGDTILSPGKGTVSMPDRGSITVYAQWAPAMTTLPFTGGNAQVPTIWLYAGFALMLIALGVMMPMLRMRMAATKRTGKHMPITGGKHAK